MQLTLTNHHCVTTDDNQPQPTPSNGPVKKAVVGHISNTEHPQLKVAFNTNSPT